MPGTDIIYQSWHSCQLSLDLWLWNHSQSILEQQLGHGYQSFTTRQPNRKKAKDLNSDWEILGIFRAPPFKLLNKHSAAALPACWQAHCYPREAAPAIGGGQNQRPTGRMSKPAHSRNLQCTGIEGSFFSFHSSILPKDPPSKYKANVSFLPWA